jgi:hypothetical protein
MKIKRVQFILSIVRFEQDVKCAQSIILTLNGLLKRINLPIFSGIIPLDLLKYKTDHIMLS